MPLFCNKTFERKQQEFRAFIWWMENLINMFFVFTPSVGVKHFWMDLDERHISMPTPSVVVYIWVVCT